MAKGSLSVFCALIMVAVMGLIFTMSECIRLYELHDFAQEYTDMAVDSAFSEYNPYLWENYKILAVDLGYGTENVGPGIMERKTLEYCKYNSSVESGHNYARLSADYCSVGNYALLTDDKGAGIVTLGVKAAKDGMASQIIDGIQGKLDSINNIEKVPVEEKAKAGKSSLEEARAANAVAKEAAENDDNPDTNASDYPDPGYVEDDPLDAFDLIKESFSKSVLATVTDVSKVSESEIKLDEMPSHRNLQQGTMEIENSKSVVDKALFIDYIMSNYGYFGHSNHDGLKYEIEYMLSGAGTDSQALASVVEQIMLVREAANYMTILNNPSLEAQAAAVATATAGFSGNPAIVELVKYGIIAAWAYAEATLDLRLILSGGKVAAIKSLDQWTSDVWHLSSIGNVKCKARDCGEGLGYKEYLMAFLALRTNATLSMRALDVLENALNSKEDYVNVRVDNMVWAANVSLGYSAKEMFMSIFSNNSEAGLSGDYYFEKATQISY